ncbi:MAG TPA: septum formation protein Maf [Treponema sp.]|nr:septum formation protein Maf [Treponema sp.]
MESIVLASGSLRRQEYFRLLGLPFSIMPAMINEEITGEGDPEKMAEELAVRKVERIIELLTGRLPQWIFGADTVISVDDDIFGKPANRENARQMLLRLSGREHKVITALALYNGKEKKIDSRVVTCLVRFAKLSKADIEWYLETGEWQGVAGAYRIQGLAGCFITSIQGSPSAVVGLPLHEFYVMLKKNGYPYGG